MTAAALAIAVLALIGSVVSARYQHMIQQWTRDAFAGREPKPWHVRYRASANQALPVTLTIVRTPPAVDLNATIDRIGKGLMEALRADMARRRK